MYSGIDISRWQGDIDFATMRSSGISFVIHKAGGSNSGVYTDSKYSAVVPQARAAGMRIGHYWFNGPAGSPSQGADHMVDNLSGYSHQDILVLDIENEGGMARWNPGQAAEFLDRLRARIPGCRLYIYMNQSDLASSDWTPIRDRGVGLWIAAPGSSNPRTAPWAEWDIHQYTFTGRFPGYGGDLDGDWAKPRVWDGSGEDDGFNDMDRYSAKLVLESQARVELSTYANKSWINPTILGKSQKAVDILTDVRSELSDIADALK